MRKRPYIVKPEDPQRWRAAYEGGKALHQIVADDERENGVRVTPITVWRYLLAAGVKTRKPGPRSWVEQA